MRTSLSFPTFLGGHLRLQEVSHCEVYGYEESPMSLWTDFCLIFFSPGERKSLLEFLFSCCVVNWGGLSPHL